MEKKLRRRGQRPEDFKVTIKYIEIDDKEAEELNKKLEQWFYKVLFTGEGRKSTKKS
jgi:TFIIF-interacting CTD phosphatase-like protein